MSAVVVVCDSGASSRAARVPLKHPIVIVLLLGAAIVIAARASAQEFRWVSGTVVAWTSDTLTVLVPAVDANVTFVLDDESLVLPPPGVHLSPGPGSTSRQSFPPGAAVEVHYVRQPTRNHARLVWRPAPGRSMSAGTSMLGVVTALSDRQVTVRADEKQERFAVAPATRVVAVHPPSTPGGSDTHPGETPKLEDYVSVRDRVLVYYRPDDHARAAIEIAVLRKHE